MVLRYTAMHTRKLHTPPKIKALINEYDSLVVAILTRESDKRFFIGVLIIKIETKSAPERFPRYTINQFFNTCLRLAFFSMREIIKRELPVNNSVLKRITNTNPIGKTKPDRILAIL